MEKQTFTLQELQAALISMPPRTYFSHPYFSDEEFIYRDEDGRLRDENGYFPIESEFFAIRKEFMADGWYIKNNRAKQNNQETKAEKQPNISEKEIQELYAKAKEIIKAQPNREINVSEFNIIYDMFDSGNPQRVDIIRLIKSKLDFIHLTTVNNELWEAHMAHLPATLRRETLKRILEKYS